MSLTDKEAAWAFGEDWRDLELRVSPGVWNERHSDLFLIHPWDEIAHAECYIKEAFYNEKKKAPGQKPKRHRKVSKKNREGEDRRTDPL